VKRVIIVAIIFMMSRNVFSLADETVFPGADELTPSKSMFCDWLNSEWPGSNERKTLANLDFFKWLHDEYGMKLDIYLLDAGNVCGGDRLYRSLDSRGFRDKFPNGIEPLYEKAKAFGCRLGFWLGPDGFGNTPEEAKKRTDLLVDFCKKYNFGLFKFDRACSDLSQKNEKPFINAMTLCRKYCPDLITLNHRINVSEQAKKHMTTWLWQGQETYIDVHMKNEMTAPHHRACTLVRGLVPDLQRLTEDCGTCVSSCMDYWEDDLIIQAFNRNLICAPEIYGNPWLLSDDEFPKLARIFNLHRKYRDIMVKGMVLPEDRYGPHAVSRGDRSTRLITLRNASWTPVTYTVELNQAIGLEKEKEVSVIQYHPTEKYLGRFNYGSKVEVEVFPFRACLIKADTKPLSEPVVNGCDYEVVQDIPSKPLRIKLLGFAGKEHKIRLEGDCEFSKAKIGDKRADALTEGRSVEIDFPGEAFSKPYHRKIRDMSECEIPDDADVLYEATCFAADNDPLEVRCLYRAGKSSIEPVRKAREAFFNHPDFVIKEIWDKYAFDGNFRTSYSIRNFRDTKFNEVAFRLDMGKVTDLDALQMNVAVKDKLHSFAQDTFLIEASKDLITWQKVEPAKKENSRLVIRNIIARYLRISPVPLHITNLIGFKKQVNINRDNWRASNLFNIYGDKFKAQKAWSCSFTVDEVPKGSYLCIAINGKHGVEGAYAAIKVDGQYVGAPDRSPSFQANAWERIIWEADNSYTYYIPLNKDMIGKKIEAYVLGFDKDNLNLNPQVWMTAYPIPFEEKVLTLYR